MQSRRFTLVEPVGPLNQEDTTMIYPRFFLAPWKSFCHVRRQQPADWETLTSNPGKGYNLLF